MLLWSLWLATALVRWLPWAWQQLSHLNFWPQPATEQVAEHKKQTGNQGLHGEQQSDQPAN